MNTSHDINPSSLFSKISLVVVTIGSSCSYQFVLPDCTTLDHPSSYRSKSQNGPSKVPSLIPSNLSKPNTTPKQRSHTLPEATTESAREARKTFFCTQQATHPTPDSNQQIFDALTTWPLQKQKATSAKKATPACPTSKPTKCPTTTPIAKSVSISPPTPVPQKLPSHTSHFWQIPRLITN